MKNKLSIVALVVAVVSLGVSVFGVVSVVSLGSTLFDDIKSKGEELIDSVDGGENADMEAFAKKIEAYQAYMMKKQEADAAKAAEEAEAKVIADNMGIGDAPFKGSADAPIKIVEFTEYDCPYCKRHADEVLPALQKYIDDGTVAYYVRDFIVHDSARPKAMMAECAKVQGDNEAYFKAHDYMFDNMGQNFTAADVAKAAGVNSATLEACVKNEDTAELVDGDSAVGRTYGVSGTPGFFVNGYFIKGAYPISEFERVIEEKLNQ